ncbi:hypothetical protein COLO4_22780 [Corchorus olitorius]|uniref:Probable purine permease n=1 Tax=Corchorus olitorius TaxID=93759 RepID=A0A1R3IJV6_9ROSI|nr:hypothetical protein COLO4_22780 [Corchorus olitorius]
MADCKATSSTISQRTESRTQTRSNMIPWLRIGIFTLFAVCGQTSAVLLTRLYYEKGGKSNWVAAVLQLIGFPILIPYYFTKQPKLMEHEVVVDEQQQQQTNNPPKLQLLVFVYVSLGILAAGNSFLYSVGFEYLPVSTVTIISASQLAFNAFFSYFLNKQKLTPFIINSLFILTVSSVLLVANDKSGKLPGTSAGQYAAGIICTIFGAATYALLFASQQLAFRKVLKKQTFKVVMDVIIYQFLVASIITLIGFFAAGDWRNLKTEMEGFQLGKVSYIMTLFWTAVSYQIFNFGAVALIFEVSALFSNVINALGLPITPIIAIFVFHDKMSGVKGISMVLAIWGFFSYVYQQYLDDSKFNAQNYRNGGSEVCEA